jgi:hypothetical protein
LQCSYVVHATNFANVNATLCSFYISEVYHLEMPATETVAVLRDNPVSVASPMEAKSKPSAHAEAGIFVPQNLQI